MIRTTTTASYGLPCSASESHFLATCRLMTILLRCATGYPVRRAHHSRQLTSAINFKKERKNALPSPQKVQHFQVRVSCKCLSDRGRTV